jgi:hypothetical protein
MTARLIHLLFAVSAAASASAYADTLYKCTDDSGQVLYTNQKNTGRNCSVLAQDQPVSTVPPTRAPARNANPGDFPRVDGEVQKSRDNDRRKILEQELATEQEVLDKAQKDLAEQEATRNGDEKNYARVLERLQPYKDSVALHERNIEALNRELGNLRQ